MVAREDAWRRRVDRHVLALDPPGWLLAELGPVPTDPKEWAVWSVAAAELDGYRRAYGLDQPGPAKHVGGRLAPAGRSAVAATPLAGEQAEGTGQRRQPGRRDGRARRRGDLWRPRVAAGQRQRIDADRLLGGEPRRQATGRRRDWQTARAALERLAGWDRHRDHRHQRHPHRDQRGRQLDRIGGRQERDGR
jgi:hypothetical protein